MGCDSSAPRECRGIPLVSSSSVRKNGGTAREPRDRSLVHVSMHGPWWAETQGVVHTRLRVGRPSLFRTPQTPTFGLLAVHVPVPDLLKDAIGSDESTSCLGSHGLPGQASLLRKLVPEPRVVEVIGARLLTTDAAVGEHFVVVAQDPLTTLRCPLGATKGRGCLQKNQIRLSPVIVRHVQRKAAVAAVV